MLAVQRTFRIILTLVVIVYSEYVWGQYEIYTPQGTKVIVFIREEMTEAEKEDFIAYVNELYPNAICMEEPTNAYNCHDYAWYLSEGGEEYWMNDPYSYMHDGSYLLTNRWDPKANKLFYDNISYLYTHSAVIPFANSRYVISKWGNGPLVKHLPTDCPYDASNLKYYKLSMEITGEENIPLPDINSKVTKNYTLTNVPYGASVEWTVEGGGISIVSGQGTNTLQTEITSTRTASIGAKVYCNTGLVVNIPFDLYVTASAAPIITDIQLIRYGSDYILKAVTNEPEGIFTWSISGNAELCENPYAGDASFQVEPNTYTGVRFYEKGVYTVTVSGRRSDSWYDYIFSKDFTITEVF